jgi:HEAT repeat protein
VAALGDREAAVRESAAWALAQIEDSETGQALIDAFMKESNTEVRLAEMRAISFLGIQSRAVLDAALASKDVELRARAVRMLAGAGAGAWPEPRPRPRPRPSP